MGFLFCSMSILEKQQFLPVCTLKLYWELEGLEEMEVREVVRKIEEFNLLERERVNRSIFEDRRFCIRAYDFVLELYKKMKVDEEQGRHIN